MISGWKHPIAGFEEANPSVVPLRSNPHMHLFEAFLTWLENPRVKNPERWLSCLNEIGDLCLSAFVSDENGSLREYYNHDWSVMRDHTLAPIEPGHQFEWAWLLTRWGKMVGRKDALIVARRLVEIGERGVDESLSLAQNGLDFSLNPADRAFRLWPQTERIKAWLMMAETAITPEDRENAYAKVADAASALKRFSTMFYLAFGWTVLMKREVRWTSPRQRPLFIISSAPLRKCIGCWNLTHKACLHFSWIVMG